MRWQVLICCSMGLLLGSLPRVWAQVPVRYTLSGVVLQAADSMPVPYAHLYMSDMRDFAITDTQGRFAISYVAGDTLQVSSVSHIGRWIPLDKPLNRNRQDTIWLRTRIYRLSSVQVYANNPMEKFYSHRRINYTYRSPSISSALTAQPRLRAGSPKDIVGLSIVLEGVLSSLLTPLTSEYKQLKRVQELVREKHVNKYYKQLKAEKLSNEFVQAHTHLRAEEIQDFIDFWNPSLVTLDIAAEYDLIDLLHKQEKRYITYIEQVNSHRSFPQRITTLELRQWLDLTMPFGKK